jgi:hypothetical protein
MNGFILGLAIGLIIGLIIGASVGLSIMVLLVNAKESDAEMERTITIDEPNYKCKQNSMIDCKDTCCKFCLGSPDCSWACGGEPSTCGQGVEYWSAEEILERSLVRNM